MSEELQLIIAPPAVPLEVPSPSEWGDYERRLGTPLPDDYRRLIECYGTCGFDGFIWVFNPKSSETYFNLLDQSERILRGERELRDQYGRREVPVRLFPELGGLLPFGNTGNGDTLFWQTLGEPNRWTVVVNGSRSPDYEELPTNVTGFLAGVLSARMRCRRFPDDFPSANPAFMLPAYLR